MTIKTTTAPLAPAIADRLLDLLSTDDLFRERFQRDPLTALRSIGHAPEVPARMTACGETLGAMPQPFDECKVQELAPKEAIAAARGEIRAMLLRGLSQETPKLDATLGPDRFVRK